MSTWRVTPDGRIEVDAKKLFAKPRIKREIALLLATPKADGRDRGRCCGGLYEIGAVPNCGLYGPRSRKG